MKILSPEEARRLVVALDDDFAERLGEAIAAQVAMGSTILIDGIGLEARRERPERCKQEELGCLKRASTSSM